MSAERQAVRDAAEQKVRDALETLDYDEGAYLLGFYAGQCAATSGNAPRFAARLQAGSSDGVDAAVEMATPRGLPN